MVVVISTVVSSPTPEPEPPLLPFSVIPTRSPVMVKLPLCTSTCTPKLKSDKSWGKFKNETEPTREASPRTPLSTDILTNASPLTAKSAPVIFPGIPTTKMRYSSSSSFMKA